MFQNTKDSSEGPANKKWPLNPPDFHWQCHHLQQRMPTHEKWNIVHHPLGTPSAGGPWRGQPTGREKGDECKATSALRNMDLAMDLDPLQTQDTYLFSCPERGLGLLIHLPDVMILNWEDDKATWIFLQQRLFLYTGFAGFGLLLKEEKNRL